MARIAEPQKMENIKKAVMEALIDYGYGGMSIASVSEKAKVSPGYLYRYYKSKEELVKELADSVLGEIIDDFLANIDSSSTLYEAGYKTIKKLFMKANQEPLWARFAALVVMDTKIPGRDKADNYKIVMEMAEKCIRLGNNSGELDQSVTATEVLVFSFSMPFRYLSVSFELDKNKKFTEEEVIRIAKISVNAFK